MAKRRKKELDPYERLDAPEIEKDLLECDDVYLKAISNMFQMSSEIIENLLKNEVISYSTTQKTKSYLKTTSKINSDRKSLDLVDKMRKTKHGFMLFNDEDRRKAIEDNYREYSTKDFDFIEHVKNRLTKWFELDFDEREIWNENALSYNMKQEEEDKK